MKLKFKKYRNSNNSLTNQNPITMINLKSNLKNDVEKVNAEFKNANDAEIKTAFLPVSKYTICDEQWKPLADINPRYFISNYGRIIDVQNGKKLYPFTSHTGYYLINLTHLDGLQHQYFVHRLVALSFCDGFNPKFDVDHIDEDKTNNYYRNLRWVTQKYNRGTRNAGRKQPHRSNKIHCLAIPCDEKLCYIDTMPLKFESYAACARYFGVHRKNVEVASKTQEFLIKGHQIIDNLPTKEK